QDTSFLDTASQKFYADFVKDAGQDVFAPDKAFCQEEQELLRESLPLVLRQTMAVRGYSEHLASARNVSPEVRVMLSIIMSKCFPSDTHERCYSAPYALSRLPGAHYGEVSPVVRLRKTADLIVRRVCEEFRVPSSCCAPYTSQFDATGSSPAEVGLTQYGYAQHLVYSRSARPQGPTEACVTPARSIVSLLTSALYHRRAVGMSGPLIGLSYNGNGGPTVQLHIAWLDEDVEAGVDLPVPHLCSSRPDGRPTTFDLGRLDEALQLVFVLGRAKRATQDPSSRANDTFPWRADVRVRDVLDDSTYSHPTGYSKPDAIALWIKEVEEATSMAFKSLPSSSNPSNSDPLNFSTTYRANSEVDGSTREENSASSKPRSGAEEPVDSEGFVKRDTRLPFPRTQRYFVLRKVVFCDGRKGVRDLCKVPKAAIHATAPIWFGGDIASVRPYTASDQEGLLVELLEAYGRQSDCFIGDMTKGVQELVQRSLHAVFHIVQAVRLIYPVDAATFDAEGAEAREAATDAACRAHWDQLLQVLVANFGVQDIQYQKNATLRYPAYTPPATYFFTAEEVGRVAGNDVRDFYNAVFPDTATYYRQFKYHRRILDDEYQTGDGAAHEEPRVGAADGVLYLSVEGVYPSRAVADAVAVWLPNVARSEGPEHEDEYSEVVDWSLPAWDEDANGAYAGSVFHGVPRRPFDSAARAEYQRWMRDEGGSSPLSFPDIPAPARAAASRPADSRAPHALSLRENQHRKSDPASAQQALASAAQFPVLVCEFAPLHQGWTEIAATDRERLALVAVCTFMRLFNIARFPIFGLVTKGPVGVLSSAWNEVVKTPTHRIDAPESVHNAIVIADANAITVDLRNPIYALNVATALAYIVAEHAPRLRRLFANLAWNAEQGDQRQLLVDKDGPTPLSAARRMTEADAAWRKSWSAE
ncbi:hypothetical protein HDZ31DRAFT_30877, partial [Schizophyllum fasciatum]